ncbi:MAG TPA: class I SAM-dependent methyltransferase [Frankiaceae bacterium]|nr:class I SAM-dependent methyltransferase [Frankiaceae bacterium]
MTLTGERTLPGVPEENYWFRRHEAAYLALAPFALGAVVLEAGCGEGYGAALLARTARRVVALDADPTAAAHAAGAYPRAAYPHVQVVRADLHRLPVAAGGAQVVAGLQVIEHLADQEGFLAECARVLRPAGTLLLTTPNRLTFSPGRDTPLNPFHTRELSAGELVTIVEKDFVVTRLLGLRHGRRLRRWERRCGSLVDAQLAGPPATWSPSLRRRVERVRAADFTLSGDGVDASLDLAIVAYRRP